MALKPRTFVDFDASFMPNPVTGDLSVRTDEQAVKFAIRSLILTNYFERPFQSGIGSSINQLLFDNIGPNFDIILKQSITDTINNYEPRVDVLGVTVDYRDEKNSVTISIVFRIKNTEKPIDIAVTLKRTR